MEQLPLLMIADTSVPEALGSKLMNGATSLGLEPGRDIQVAYTSPAVTYSPSMQRLRGKVFFRLADRRSWEWWRFQNELLRQIRFSKPKLVLVTGVLPLKSEIFHELHNQKAHIINYLTDDPWNPIHRRRSFLRNLPLYDHIFSTKKALCSRLEMAGTPSTSWLPFAYDPTLHHATERNLTLNEPNVLFVGTGAAERLPWLATLENLPGLKRRIHGNNWKGLSTPGWDKQPAVTGEQYCSAIQNADIVLGLLRDSNRDLSTDRSYEIGAIGGCGLYQDSSEHRELLPNYPNEGFFKTPKQLREKVQHLMIHPKLRQHLRKLGSEALRKPENTYAARLQTMLKWSEQQGASQ
ncbi:MULTISPECIES: glycosyltransferase [unclassified Synechococcus]|nr:glycosyltransferase [Synechococcus sp. MIT S9220]